MVELQDHTNELLYEAYRSQKMGGAPTAEGYFYILFHFLHKYLFE